ncbi:unnamed protein product [Linum tenue]|uniref:Uncharacterized protein n=1 Tax=Linum tenue TaxID=586396 RepID=A0AAV0JAH4_9ROSI|nr:unnamed protein product [Linum tenue]
MAVFHMSSDGYFVRTWPTSSSVDVYVIDYTGDVYDPDLIRYWDAGRWRGSPIKVGPSGDSKFRALEVHGVVIEGNQLTQLWNDLTLVGTSDGGQNFCLVANRNGLCFLLVGSPSVKRLRVNDYFGWAKYGVKPPIGTSTIWNRCDLSSGETLVDVGLLLKNKEKEMQGNKEVESLWEKSVQEKDKQLAMVVERNKEVESMWEKSSQEKDKRLVKLMDAMQALIYEV